MSRKKANNKSIDKLFRDGLKHYEIDESFDANWFFIKKTLESKKKKKNWIYRITGGVVFLMIIGIFLIKNYPFDIEKNKNTSISSRILIQNDFNKIKIENKSTIEKESNHMAINNYSKKQKPEPSTSFEQYNDRIDKEIDKTIIDEAIKNPFMNEQTSEEIKSTSRTVYIPWVEDSIKIIIHPCIKEINSPYPDYAPVINADGTEMYFTSTRPVDQNERKKRKNENTENIYYSKYEQKSNKWSNAKLLPYPVNVPGRFNSAVALSNDGQRLFIYRDDDSGNGDIYESQKRGDVWTEPQRLPEPINSQYHESTISLSPDGNTIYFTSNRPGGKGGMDIWYCKKQKNGLWGEAKNLEEINTDKDEEGVFMHPDGKTLYFSSRGHNTLGGYDIFYTQWIDGKWIKPINLGKEVNTKDDDVYFVVEANGQNAYFSTIRKDGMGEKDIYKLTFVYSEDQKKKTAQLTLFKGNVVDKQNQHPLEAEIELFDLEKDEKITTLKSEATTGAFMISLPAGKNYAINVKKEGYLFYSENFNIPAGDVYKEVQKTIMLDKLKAGAKVVLRNIFYDYNQATLRPESKIELDKVYDLLIQNPNLKIEFSAHTDSRGSDDYNLKLSQQRAQSCVDYLIKKGIAPDRIKVVGYGEKFPVISDAEIEKLPTEAEKEAAHQQNRRTEIKILEN